jgi:phosphatidylglycerol---prolipoprotein diacylglyceryl transferase
MINPIAFKIGNVLFGYYDLVYIFGFLTAFIVFLVAAHNKEINLNKKQAAFYLLLGIIGAMLGAKLFHLLFWSFSFLLADPTRIFRIWGPGWSIHGGLVGIVIVGVLVSKFKKISFLKMADILILPALFFLALGRVANFVNQEIVGTVTSVPWCYVFINREGCRHPVTLYASIGRFALFFVLFWIERSREFKKGFLFWNFIFWMGLGRFILDFWREGTDYFGLLAGQWLSIPMILIGGFVLIRYYKRDIEIL